MSDLTKILAENQKEMLKLIPSLSKKQPVYLNNQDSDSEPENISVARTSTPVKTTNATNSKTTPTNSRNTTIFCVLVPFQDFRASIVRQRRHPVVQPNVPYTLKIWSKYAWPVYQF